MCFFTLKRLHVSQILDFNERKRKLHYPVVMKEKVTEFSSVEINNILDPHFHTLHNRDAVVLLFKESINPAISSDIERGMLLGN